MDIEQRLPSSRQTIHHTATLVPLSCLLVCIFSLCPPQTLLPLPVSHTSDKLLTLWPPACKRFAYFVSTASRDKRILLLISAESGASSVKVLRRGRGLALQGVSIGNVSSAADGYVGGRFVVSCWSDRYVVGVNGRLVV